MNGWKLKKCSHVVRNITEPSMYWKTVLQRVIRNYPQFFPRIFEYVVFFWWNVFRLSMVEYKYFTSFLQRFEHSQRFYNLKMELFFGMEALVLPLLEYFTPILTIPLSKTSSNTVFILNFTLNYAIVNMSVKLATQAVRKHQ